MRGEYRQKTACTSTASELPPHARRILADGGDPGQPLGTTSACAENTPYQRVFLGFWELPPHARRIHRVDGW